MPPDTVGFARPGPGNTGGKAKPEAGSVTGRMRALPMGAGTRSDVTSLPLGAEIYTEALRVRPRDIKLRLRVTNWLKQLDRYREALAVLTQGLALMPDAVDLQTERIAVLQRAGQFDTAASALTTFASQHPDHPKLCWLQGDLASARGDHAAAAEIYGEMLLARPLDVRCRVRLTNSLRLLDRHEEALAVLAEGLALVPGSADLLIERISVLQRSGRLDAAAEAIAALAELHPNHPRLLGLKGELAVASGDYQSALELFDADLTHYPRDVGRRLRMANRLQLSGSTREALALIGQSPWATQAERVARVHALTHLGRWREAANELDSWPADTPRAEIARARSRVQLALLAFDFAAARSHAEQLLAGNPGDVNAALALAQAATLTFDTNAAWLALRGVPISPVGSGPARLGGRRLRHSFGQLVNEFRLRPDETRILAAAASLPGEAQARRAADVLQRDPGNLAATLALLIGMARAGRLDGCATAGASPRRIPQKLHQYWDRDPPPDIERLMKETAELNPGYAYHCWNDAMARPFLAASGKPGLLRAYREARHVAIRADIFRLALLFAEGGVYLDADDRCTGPLEALLPAEAEAVFYQENTGSVGNNFLAATPGHPVIGQALDEAVLAVLQGAGESAWLATGPGLLSRVVAAAVARDPSLRLPGNMRIVPLRVFRESVQACRSVRYKQGAQHWPRAA